MAAMIMTGDGFEVLGFFPCGGSVRNSSAVSGFCSRGSSWGLTTFSLGVGVSSVVIRGLRAIFCGGVGVFCAGVVGGFSAVWGGFCGMYFARSLSSSACSSSRSESSETGFAVWGVFWMGDVGGFWVGWGGVGGFGGVFFAASVASSASKSSSSVSSFGVGGFEVAAKNVGCGGVLWGVGACGVGG